jgi:cobalt transporter subunit CbtA
MRRALIAALAAGFVACVFVTAAQQAVVAPLILKAEEYEEANAAKAAPAAQQPAAHQHAAGQPAHSHEDEGWKPGEGIERIAYTALANLGFGVGFGLLLVAAFVLSGREVDWKRGLAWGAGGFAVFALAPALGLPPELPGAASADLLARQTWWLGTVAATAAGLALLVFGKNWPWKLLGMAVLAAPHVLGAPHPPGGGDHGGVPAELVQGFVVLSLVVTALFWAVLGAVSGAVYARVR